MILTDKLKTVFFEVGRRLQVIDDKANSLATRTSALESAPAPTSSVALSRANSGQSLYSEQKDDFSTDPLATGKIFVCTGITGGSSNPLTYDNTGMLIKQTDASGSGHFWTYKAAPSSKLDYSVDVNLISDSAGLKHLGVWINASNSVNTPSGYRLTSLSGNLAVSYWLNGVESTGPQLLSAPLAWAIGETKTLRVKIDFTTGIGEVFAGGVSLGTWTDLRFTSGLPGGFSYGCVASWDNLDFYSPAAKVNGLPASYILRNSSYLSTTNQVIINTEDRVDVTNANGLVKGSAWMKAGDIWNYGSQSYLYYRMNITSNNGDSVNTGVNELILRSTTGGAQQATGGTATASSESSAYNQTAAKAFDGITDSTFGDGSGVWVTSANAPFPHTLAYHFPSSVHISEYVVYSGQSAGRSVKSWTLEGSQDGVTWVVVDNRTNQIGWTQGEGRTFTID